MTVTHHSDDVAGAPFVRRAWVSLLGFVPSFGLAFLVGEGLISALGYPSGGAQQAPWWAALLAVTPALVVFALPAVAASYFGMRAMHLGDSRGRLPMLVAIALAVGFVLINALSAAATWLA